MLRNVGRLISIAAQMRRGRNFACSYRTGRSHGVAAPKKRGSLEAHFDANREGPGIWKWRHYFPIYERHFGKFVGKEVHVAEVGIYSGGSLTMWRSYFGPQCSVYGIDREPACRQYEGERVAVFIGDQGDRSFWERFREKVPQVDILIDDGGHLPKQQRVTLEELLPHLRPGGVYLCEDVHGFNNRFGAYISGLQHALHFLRWIPDPVPTSSTNSFQRDIQSIHIYPFCVVIEKTDSPLERLTSPKHGTQWQPFFSRHLP
jgi:hypothetical protein